MLSLCDPERAMWWAPLDLPIASPLSRISRPVIVIYWWTVARIPKNRSPFSLTVCRIRRIITLSYYTKHTYDYCASEICARITVWYAYAWIGTYFLQWWWHVWAWVACWSLSHTDNKTRHDAQRTACACSGVFSGRVAHAFLTWKFRHSKHN